MSGYTGNLDVNFWYKDTSAKTGGLKATVGNAFDPVKLSWGKAADDVTGYRVYRYDEKQKKYVYMKQTSGKKLYGYRCDKRKDLSVQGALLLDHRWDKLLWKLFFGGIGHRSAGKKCPM